MIDYSKLNLNAPIINAKPLDIWVPKFNIFKPVSTPTIVPSTPPTQTQQNVFTPQPTPQVTQSTQSQYDTEKIKRFIQRWKDLGKSKNEIKSAYDKAISQGIFNIQEQPQPEQTFSQKVWQSYWQPILTLWNELVKKPVDRFLDYIQWRELDPANTYSWNDIWKTLWAWTQAWFNAVLPWLSAWFNVAWSTKLWEKVLWSVPWQVWVWATLWGIAWGKKWALIWGAIGTIPWATDFMLNNVPWLKDYYNSLDEWGKQWMQTTLSNLAMAWAWVWVWKLQGKTPQETAQQLNNIPTNVAHGLVDAIKTMPENVKSSIQNSKEVKFNKWIEEIYQAVNPTTRENKVQLRQKVKDLLPYIDEKNIFNNELDQVKSRVDTVKNKAFDDMVNYETNVWVKWIVNTWEIIKKLKEKYQEKVWKSYINPDEAKVSSQLIKTLQWFWETVKDNNIIKIRRAWDEIIKKNKWFLQSAESNIKGDIFNEANKFFREEIRKSNPKYAKYLEQAHKTIWLSDILEATIQRRTWQTQWWFLRKASENTARTIGTWLWATVWTMMWMPIVWAVAWAWATELLLSWVHKLTGSSAKLTKGKRLILKSKENGTNNNDIHNRVNTDLATNKKLLTKWPRLESKISLDKALTKPQTQILTSDIKHLKNPTPENITKTIEKSLNVKGKTEQIKKIVTDFIKREWAKRKEKIGDLLDEIATKIGAKLNFISDKGSGISGAVDSNLIDEAKKYKSAEEFINNIWEELYILNKEAKWLKVSQSEKEKIYKIKNNLLKNIAEDTWVYHQFTNWWIWKLYKIWNDTFHSIENKYDYISSNDNTFQKKSLELKKEMWLPKDTKITFDLNHHGDVEPKIRSKNGLETIYVYNQSEKAKNIHKELTKISEDLKNKPINLPIVSPPKKNLKKEMSNWDIKKLLEKYSKIQINKKIDLKQIWQQANK